MNGRAVIGLLGVAVAGLALGGPPWTPAQGAEPTRAEPAAAVSDAAPAGVALCSRTDAPEYYRIDLVSTRRVARTARSRGAGEVTFSRASPFTVALSPDGSYQYDVRLSFEFLPDPAEGVYAVWLATTQLDRVQPVGVLSAGQREITGTAEWNQFLVVVSLEPGADAVGERWTGPIVMRGISRSGFMHTMAGHGPFEQENCAVYGYE